MNDNFSDLTQSIENKNFQKAQQMLDSMMLKEPEFHNHSKIQRAIIVSSLKVNAIEGLTLLNHPFCHGDWYENDHLKSGQHFLANIILDEKKFDLIEPCILKSLTTMQLITSSLISSNNTEGIDYIIKHDRLEFDYGSLKTQYILAFRHKENLETIQQISSQVYHTPKIIHQCFEHSISSYNVEGLQYLFKEHSIATLQVASYFLETIEKQKINFDYNFNALTNLRFKENMAQFLTELHTTLKQHTGFENTDKMTLYFLEPFIKNSYQMENLFDHVYQFLNTVYQDSNIPLSIMEHIKQKNKQDFKDFDVYYEKRKLDESISRSSEKVNSLKL